MIDAQTALGAARLRVLDLAQGQQPCTDSSGRWSIAYNGEVYNFLELREQLLLRGHRFVSRCDTEVVLHAWMEWGADSAARFEGGYAFAVLDRLEHTLWLVRDRYGKRPLFYTWAGNCLLFASEMKAFFGHEHFQFVWDEEVLGSLFGHWTCVGAETPFRGIRQVQPGCTLQVRAGQLREVCYAKFPLPSRSSPLSFEEAAEQALSLLRGSVRRRLRSDVEVAVTLSGGLDSAIIAALTQELQPGRLRAFSVGFADPAYDESADQRLIAGELGIAHDALRVTGEEISGHFASALWHAELPQFRTAFVPMYLLAQRIREQGIAVVLSGEGADEVFLGYDVFRETRLRASWNAFDDAQRQQQIAALYRYLPHFSGENAAALAAVFARSTGDSRALLFSHALRLDIGAVSRRLLRAVPAQPDSLQCLAEAAGLAASSPVDRAQWLEVNTLLQGYLLSSQGDRMTFAHGVEARNPFLAPDVVEFAAALPEAHLLSAQGCEKHLLKHAFAALLPKRIVDKPKQPYRAPDAVSFFDGAEPLPWVQAVLSPAALANVAPLDAPYAQRLLAKIQGAGGRRLSPREDQAFLLLLSLVMLDQMFVRGEGRARVSPLRPVRRTVAGTWKQP